MNITLRDAAPSDLELVIHWDEQPHVLASDPDDDWNWAVELKQNPEWRAQLIAELDGRPIGFLQIIDACHEESHYWGDVPEGYRAIDIWIGEADDLGKGYGTQMMKLAIDRCFSDPKVIAILIDPLASNSRAHRFYERIGFTFLRNQIFHDCECYVYQLTRFQYEAL